LKWDPGYGRVGIGTEGVGGVLVNVRTSLKVKTNCRFEKFKAEVKIIL